MVKSKIKKIVVMMLMSALVIGTTQKPVFAASTVSGQIGSFNCNGRLDYARTSAGTANGVIAVTTFGAAGNLKATATVYYKVNGTARTKTATNYSNGAGTSATAYTNDVGSVYGGKGSHEITFGAYTWHPADTYIGTTW